MNTQIMIIDFSKSSDISSWKVVDDVVMGGKSSGNFEKNVEGNAVFSGKVSLENNGGFSSVRCQFFELILHSASKIVLRVKGDGNFYKLRIKKNKNDYFSYSSTFKTSENWESISIQLSDMQPVFRGRMLDIPNYSSKSIEEIAFLISNKKAQNFKLEIDKIYFE